MSTPIVARTDGRLGDPIVETYQDYMERRRARGPETATEIIIGPTAHRNALALLNRLYDEMDLLPIYADFAPLLRRAGEIERVLLL